MEFQYEERICGFQNVCAGSMAESDDEETLSFCDMLLCDNAGTGAELASTQRVSNPESSDHQDFHFDFDFGGSISTACQTSAADDLIFNGSIFPLSERKDRLSYKDSNSFWQNEILLNEKLQAWRSESSDSLESKSSYWTSSISDNSQASYRSFNYSASQKGLRPVNSTAFSNKSNSMSNWTSFSSGSRSKRSSGCLQFFSLGINKTPVMKLEDLRLRQCKRNENGVDKPVLKRSVSSYYEEGPILKKKVATFHQRSESVKENKRAVETRRTKGFSILALFTSFNSCKSSIDSVIYCTKITQCVEREDLVPSLKVPT
ncbi:hypothetical protein SUGI_0904920 [Cryptomeria japonica]|nr:hypothetical protein SUGI_0904920 [Cryptomeria japonica]